MWIYVPLQSLVVDNGETVGCELVVIVVYNLDNGALENVSLKNRWCLEISFSAERMLSTMFGIFLVSI